MKFYAYFACGLLAGLAGCKNNTTTATTAESAVKPVATVNGAAIARDTYDYYVKQVTGKASADLTVAQRGEVLDGLIGAEVAAQQAAKDGLDTKGDAQAVMTINRWQTLQSALAAAYLKDRKSTEAELKAEYDTQIAAMEKAQYKAHHILVKTQAEALVALARLKKGEKFETVAKDVSTDTESAKNGGALGDFFSLSSMVKPFGEALASLKKGEVTATPVQSEFGYHIIRLDDVRENVAPPYDSVKDRIDQIVQQKKFKAYVEGLQKTATVEKTL